MKPFNLERALAGDKIVTRDGQAARFIGYAPELWHEIQVIYTVGDILNMCNVTGLMKSTGSPHKYDLFMAPKIRTVFVNLRLNGAADHYATEEEAEDAPSYMTRLGGKAYQIVVEE